MGEQEATAVRGTSGGGFKPSFMGIKSASLTRTVPTIGKRAAGLTPRRSSGHQYLQHRSPLPLLPMPPQSAPPARAALIPPILYHCMATHTHYICLHWGFYTHHRLLWMSHSSLHIL